MEKPLVSVVVVSYNHARYIEQMLDSLKNQTYKNWELIVADDQSQDESVKVFKNWLSDNGVKAKEIYHEVNTGLATVLNEAIELCEGIYVKLIAADDYLHPECLEKSVSCLEENGEQYGMVFTDTFAVDENSKNVPDIADYNSLGSMPAEKFGQELIKGNRIAALTVLMRTKVVKETGKYDSKFIVEDYYRWLKISARYLIAYIPEKLTYYRLHEENISKRKADIIAEETLILQIMFDKVGVNKNRINDFFYSKYFKTEKISEKTFSVYKNYAFKNKRLEFCIKYKVTPFLYKLGSKFS